MSSAYRSVKICYRNSEANTSEYQVRIKERRASVLQYSHTCTVFRKVHRSKHYVKIIDLLDEEKKYT